jgi:hypothetical protein
MGYVDDCTWQEAGAMIGSPAIAHLPAVAPFPVARIRANIYRFPVAETAK